MSWYRYKNTMRMTSNKAFPNSSTKLIQFKFDWTDGGKRYGGYTSYNEKLEKAGGEVPKGLKEVGFDKFPSTFFWFETKWNPRTPILHTRNTQSDYRPSSLRTHTSLNERHSDDSMAR